ncbi:hypothetical protein [Staphylococcus saprophyticus]|uniref:hypothetical protein n=1 Tax=Staphylococcus TaxID=1279 RepID=UPI0022EADD87|nr:hypothetical protein [Staphylococcus saprophyticus]MDW4397452.1 hypothetical protein [Staphylococcus saprophyticus]
MEKINHYVYNIPEIRELINDDEYFENYYKDEVSKFETNSNPALSEYLKNKSLRMNDQNAIRTYIVINTDTLEIIGYFCLKIVNVKFEAEVSKKLKKKISSDAKKDNEFQAILITKLARNDSYKGKVSGKTIMDYALSIGYQIYKSTALKHICVDWYEAKELEEFYCNNCGFEIFQSKRQENNDFKLVSAFYKYH